MSLPCLALPALLLLAPGADGIYFEQLTISSSAGRVPGPGVASRVWYAGRRMRLEAGDGDGAALLLQLDLGKAYRLAPETRTVIELDLERLRTRAHMDAAMAGDLMGVDPAEGARSAPLAGERTIAGHPCRGFRIAAGGAVLHVYVAKDVPLGVDAFADFLDWSGAAASFPGLLEEIRSLPGFPLETRSRVSVLGVDHETVSSVTRLELGPQPAERFEPPPGWPVVRE